METSLFYHRDAPVISEKHFGFLKRDARYFNSLSNLLSILIPLSTLLSPGDGVEKVPDFCSLEQNVLRNILLRGG